MEEKKTMKDTFSRAAFGYYLGLKTGLVYAAVVIFSMIPLVCCAWMVGVTSDIVEAAEQAVRLKIFMTLVMPWIGAVILSGILVFVVITVLNTDCIRKLIVKSWLRSRDRKEKYRADLAEEFVKTEKEFEKKGITFED